MFILGLTFKLIKMIFEISIHIIKLGLSITKVFFTLIVGSIFAIFFQGNSIKNKVFKNKVFKYKIFNNKRSNFNEEFFNTSENDFNETFINNDNTEDFSDTFVYKEDTEDDSIKNKKFRFKKNKNKYSTENTNYLDQLYTIKSKVDGDMQIKVKELISVIEQILDRSLFIENSKDSTYKHLDYYLPSTINLLEKYIELNNLKNKTKKVKLTLNEIESSMDTIIAAFYKILDSLFEDSNININDEITRLKSSLYEDGLI